MINKTWDKVLEKEMKKDYFKELGFFVKSEYRKHICYPDYINIFNALILSCLLAITIGVCFFAN